MAIVSDSKAANSLMCCILLPVAGEAPVGRPT